MIRCYCGKLLFDGLIYKGVSVAQFNMGFCNVKCKQCGRWLEGIDARVFIGVDINYDFKERSNGNGKQTTSQNHFQKC